jgi:regulator of replication initiation timing
MTDDAELRKALQKALFENRKLTAEVDKLKYNLRKMRQELRQERAEHRQTALKLEAAEKTPPG